MIGKPGKGLRTSKGKSSFISVNKIRTDHGNHENLRSPF
jgi:hypothetical protein